MLHCPQDRHLSPSLSHIGLLYPSSNMSGHPGEVDAALVLAVLPLPVLGVVEYVVLVQVPREQVGPHAYEVVAPARADPDQIEHLEVGEEQVEPFGDEVGVGRVAHALVVRYAAVPDDQGLLPALGVVRVLVVLEEQLVQDQYPVYVARVYPEDDLLRHVADPLDIAFLVEVEHREPRRDEELLRRYDGPRRLQVHLGQGVDLGEGRPSPPSWSDPTARPTP